jgi:hypothetical protein
MTSELPLSPVLLQRITRDYDEQPGLCLTPAQVQQFWGLDGPTCGAVLTALVNTGVLQRTPGAYSGQAERGFRRS